MKEKKHQKPRKFEILARNQTLIGQNKVVISKKGEKACITQKSKVSTLDIQIKQSG